MSKPAASFRAWLLLAIAGVFSGFAWLAHIEPAHAVGVVVQSGPRLFTSSSSSSSGGIADGATVIRTGPSATMPLQESLLGLGGYNDSATNGASFSRTNWSIEPPAAGVNPHSSTEFVLNRTTAVLSDFRSSIEYKQTRYFDTGASGYSSRYKSWWMRYNHDGLAGGQSIQHKIERDMDVADVFDGVSGAYLANWNGGSTAFFTNFRNIPTTHNQDVIFYDNSTGNLTDIPGGDTTWRRFETWHVRNTALGTANGYYRVRITSTNGTVLVDNISTNRLYRDSGDTLANYRYIVQQNYVGNATDSGPGPDNLNATVAQDDEHFLWTTSGTGFPPRAELVNNSVYASATVIRDCELVSISGTTWTVKVNMPFSAFGVTDATGLYLALYDSAGARTMVILDATPALRVPEWLRSIDAANDDHDYQVAA